MTTIPIPVPIPLLEPPKPFPITKAMLLAVRDGALVPLPGFCEEPGFKTLPDRDCALSVHIDRAQGLEAAAE